MKRMKVFFAAMCFSFLFMKMNAQQSMNVELIGRWDDPANPVNVIGQRYSDIWGYYQNEKEYAIIGSNLGLHFIDITDTADIHQVDFVAGKYQGDAIHRDFKNYRTYLYAVCDEGPSSLQIIDMRYLPDSVHVVYDSDTIFRRVHNVWLDTSMQKLYTLSESVSMSEFNSMSVYSLVNPEIPVKLASLSNPNIGHVHDAYVRNDTAWLNCGFDGFYYMYMGNPNSPVEIGSLLFYPDQGYNHSGWLTPDGRYYIMADETHGMQMKLLDMQEGPNQLSFLDLVGSNVNQYSIPHNQIIRDHYIYVSYYHDGLQIFDISDVNNVTVAGYYDTYPGDANDTVNAYAGMWGVYPLLPSGKIIGSDMQTGLYVFQTPFTNLSVEENETMHSSSVYPNPTTGILNLSPTTTLPDQITVTDLNGKQLKIFNSPVQHSLSIEELSSGSYIVSLKYGDEIKQVRVIKK